MTSKWIRDRSDCTPALHTDDTVRIKNFTLRFKTCSRIQTRRVQSRFSNASVGLQNPNSDSGLHVTFKRLGRHSSKVLAFLTSRILAGMSCELHPSSRVCVLLLTVAATFPLFRHVDTRSTRISTVTIIVTSHPALVQQSAPLIHATLSDPEDTAIKLAAARRTLCQLPTLALNSVFH